MIHVCRTIKAKKARRAGNTIFCASFLARRPSLITTLGPRAPTTNNNNGGSASSNPIAVSHLMCYFYLTMFLQSVLPVATCGQRLDNSLNRPSYRIYGGKQSEITEQPWQAVINVYHNRSEQHLYRCGGVLIDSCWILSAAHCFQKR